MCGNLEKIKLRDPHGLETCGSGYSCVVRDRLQEYSGLYLLKASYIRKSVEERVAKEVHFGGHSG